ncbi:MAG: RHS repeat-associated protein [Cocleimonas sp.]
MSSDAIRPNKNNHDVVVNNDRLMSMAGIDYRYDASGNQISQISTGDKQQRSFNGLNQLVQINVNGKLTQYEYDALGRRSAKITELGRTDFIWDNHQLIGECTLGEYTWYIYQPDTFTPVALIKSGQVYYYHLDQLGTPICLTDENAKIVWHSQQDVFGQTIESTSIKDTDIEDAGNGHADVYDAAKQEKITNPIRFQGQYFDDESGLHYNRFRYYSPQQARFIHQDPIGLVGGINHYQYAPNPVNWVDPFGLMCKEGERSLKEALDSNVASGCISPTLSNELLKAAQVGQLTPKEIKEHLSSLPQEEGLQSVTILPVEWMVEGLADAVTIVADMFNTGPTLEGVALTAVALIPGKFADKAIEPVVKKIEPLTDTVKSVTVQGSKKIAREMDRYKVPCFKKNKKGSDTEYDRQLQGQQNGINDMSVKEFIDNREAYKKIGRSGTGAAQQKARSDFKKDLVDKYENELTASGEYFGKEARDKAIELSIQDMTTLNALHNPDMIAGGYDNVVDLGDASINKSIGSQWKNKGKDELGNKSLASRVEMMDVKAKKALEELGPETKMNVDLHRCK